MTENSQRKRIIICCDGTWNRPDQNQGGVYNPTNVVKLARTVSPVAPDGTTQIVFYDQGVGTGFGLDRLFGGAMGWGLAKNVLDGYRFVVHNFVPDDEIFLFGFSRGAYTARSIAGMIRNCGVLTKHHGDRFESAFHLYRRQDAPPDSHEARLFRQTYAHETDITCIGVWDTVGSLGIPVSIFKNRLNKRFKFHDVTLSRSVRNAFHALAIDEQRGPFKPTLWKTQQSAQQRVEQVWFPGVHSNVGGGYVEAGLSDTAFAWMKERAESCGLAFDPESVDLLVKPDITAKIYNSRKGHWKLLPKHERSLQLAPETGEAVSDAAFERMERVSTYQPKILMNFQRRGET